MYKGLVLNCQIANSVHPSSNGHIPLGPKRGLKRLIRKIRKLETGR